MAFNINDLTQYFDNPALSKFSRKTKKGFTTQIGKMIPANWDFLNFGNSIKGTSYHSLRLAPMLAPNFSDLQVQEHTVGVPLRVIMENYEETFNYAKNTDGAILPHFTSKQYHDLLLTMCMNSISPIGSLLDFLGYPVYADIFDSIQSLILYYYTDDEDLVFDPYSIKSWDFYYNNALIPFRFDASYTYRGTVSFNLTTSTAEANGNFMDFVTFLASKKYPTAATEYYALQMFYEALMRDYYGHTPNPEQYMGFTPSIDSVIEFSTFETVASAMNAYQTYLFGIMLEAYLNSTSTEDKDNYTSLPLRAYWRFHIDWNTNGNFVDRDGELSRIVYGLENTLIRYIGQTSRLAYTTLSSLLLPAERLWRSDFWTSQLPTAAVDNAIEIPANSTVLNLASLTAFQKLVLKLSYSSRYRDVVWNVFKIMPSDARLQQSSVLSRRYHSVGIGETLQTSETTTSSVLGNFAGRGYSSGKNDSYHILAEEPMIIINLFSLIPFATYSDALHPNIHMDDIFDIPIPDMDVLGNQPIKSDLLSGNVADNSEVFGFGRQYQEFLSNYDTVHGDFKTTFNYWQLTRRFDSTPYLNDQFLRMSSRDDFDTIFSVPDAPHAFVSVVYNNAVTRHVHRNVRILI